MILRFAIEEEDSLVSSSRGHRDLVVYQKAFALAMKIYQATKGFPPEERFSLTDQIRRSSRSVCSCIAEAYRKRRYEAYFVSKISDADAENSETIVWLDFAQACGYLARAVKEELEGNAEEVGRMLNGMIESPEKFLPRQEKSRVA